MFKKKVVKKAEAKPVTTPVPAPVKKEAPAPVMKPVKTVKVQYLGGSPLPFMAYGIKFTPVGDVPEELAKKLFKNNSKWKPVPVSPEGK